MLKSNGLLDAPFDVDGTGVASGTATCSDVPAGFFSAGFVGEVKEERKKLRRDIGDRNKMTEDSVEGVEVKVVVLDQECAATMFCVARWP